MDPKCKWIPNGFQMDSKWIPNGFQMDPKNQSVLAF